MNALPYSIRSISVILPLLCGVALLLLAAPARAQIALVDNELTPASPVTSSAPADLVLKTNLTVSASANTLVVMVAYRNGDTTLTECPSTLNWTNGTTTNTLTWPSKQLIKTAMVVALAFITCIIPPPGLVLIFRANYQVKVRVGLRAKWWHTLWAALTPLSSLR